MSVSVVPSLPSLRVNYQNQWNQGTNYMISTFEVNLFEQQMILLIYLGYAQSTYWQTI